MLRTLAALASVTLDNAIPQLAERAYDVRRFLTQDIGDDRARF
jgi:hypothetical protein